MKKLLFFPFLLIPLLCLGAALLFMVELPLALVVLAVLVLAVLTSPQAVYRLFRPVSQRSCQDQRYTGQPPTGPRPNDMASMRFLAQVAMSLQMLIAPRRRKHRHVAGLIAT